MFKIKTGYKVELLSKEIMKLLSSSKTVIDTNKNIELVPKLASVETVLVHCNLVTNDYQQSSKVLFSFVSDKSFGQLLNINPHSQCSKQLAAFLITLGFGLLTKTIIRLKLNTM